MNNFPSKGLPKFKHSFPPFNRSRHLQQPARLRARLVCDFGTGEHAGDFLAAFAFVKRVDAGARHRAVARFRDQPVAIGAGGDLRAVGDDQQLRTVR